MSGTSSLQTSTRASLMPIGLTSFASQCELDSWTWPPRISSAMTRTPIRFTRLATVGRFKDWVESYRPLRASAALLALAFCGGGRCGTDRVEGFLLDADPVAQDEEVDDGDA